MKKCFTLAECVAHVNLLANVKFGFTLAEVLITLGIIGIVAALTIPGLITKCKEMQYRVTYKKVYSSLNQAMKYAQEDDGVDLTLGNTIFLPNLSGGVLPLIHQMSEKSLNIFRAIINRQRHVLIIMRINVGFATKGKLVK